MKAITIILGLLTVFSAPAWALDSKSYCYGDNCVLMLHSNGTDASTTFTDDSGSSHTMTANGNAQIDTAQKKFGTASGLYDGTGAYLTTPDNADWTWGSGDLTIDFQVRFNTVGIMALFNQTEDTSNLYTMLLLTDSTSCPGGLATSDCLIWYIDTGSGGAYELGVDWTPSVDTWYHVALTRSGNTWRYFIDGTQQGSNITDSRTFPDLTGAFALGARFYGSYGLFLNGWLDEFRIVKGQAVWTSNFTAPSSEYSECSGRRVVVIA